MRFIRSWDRQGVWCAIEVQVRDSVTWENMQVKYETDSSTEMCLLLRTWNNVLLTPLFAIIHDTLSNPLLFLSISAISRQILKNVVQGDSAQDFGPQVSRQYQVGLVRSAATDFIKRNVERLINCYSQVVTTTILRRSGIGLALVNERIAPLSKSKRDKMVRERVRSRSILPTNQAQRTRRRRSPMAR